MKKGYQWILNVAMLLGMQHVAFASDDFDPFFEFLFMNGFGNVDAQGVSGFVQDNENRWEYYTVQAGIGYVYQLTDALTTGELAWFPLINPQVNWYYFDATLVADEFEPDNDLQFDSNRVMFDLGLTLVSWEDLSLYAIGGVGNAWNKLASENSTGFAYEYGAGVTYAVIDTFAVSLQYLNTSFDDVALSEDDETSFDINSQAVLLGLRFALYPI